MTYLPKILLIDDEEDFLSICSPFLRNNGFDVYSLSTEDDVFKIVRAFKPLLIILDVRMGVHDGRKICQQLKEDPGTKSIKIILHSAFSHIENEWQKYGAEDFILKPYSLSQLISKINYHLQ